MRGLQREGFRTRLPIPVFLPFFFSLFYFFFARIHLLIVSFKYVGSWFMGSEPKEKKKVGVEFLFHVPLKLAHWIAMTTAP